MTEQLLPHFIGIGAPRCGTRWLSQCLMQHPEVGIPENEVYFFSTRRMVHSFWSKGLPWYDKFLRAGIKPTSKVWGEITPFYLYDEDSAALIHQTVPNVKLICCLRDQAQRAHSWYTLFLRYNPELIHTRFSFKQFLTYSADVYGREGFYLEHIERYLQLFPRQSMLFLLYDDLVANPSAYVQRVFDFIGVDTAFTPPAVQEKINSMKTIRIPKHATWNNIATKFSRRGFHAPARWIHSFNAEAVTREELPARHQMSDEIRERMHTMFAAHNQRLGAFLGRDLTHWNTKGNDLESDESR